MKKRSTTENTERRKEEDQSSGHSLSAQSLFVFFRVFRVFRGESLCGLAWFRQDVRLDLIGVGEAVHQIEQSDDGQHFAQTLIIQTEPLHGGSVRVDSVAAIIRRRHGQRDNLLGQEIDLTWLHDGFEACPAQT